jgi:hypothetical protein
LCSHDRREQENRNRKLRLRIAIDLIASFGINRFRRRGMDCRQRWRTPVVNASRRAAHRAQYRRWCVGGLVARRPEDHFLQHRGQVDAFGRQAVDGRR